MHIRTVEIKIFTNNRLDNGDVGNVLFDWPGPDDVAVWRVTHAQEIHTTYTYFVECTQFKDSEFLKIDKSGNYRLIADRSKHGSELPKLPGYFMEVHVGTNTMQQSR